jgi:hypothetical protein
MKTTMNLTYGLLQGLEGDLLGQLGLQDTQRLASSTQGQTDVQQESLNPE